MAASGAVHVRPATPADVDTIYGFIVELAEYERAPEHVKGTPEMLHEALFGERPVAEALIAELDGEPAGSAVFHGTFSTWTCLPGLWLEDLYVSPRLRRGGVGGALLQALARIAVDRGCGRLEWHALDWNDPALSFYKRIGADRLRDWDLHRLAGEDLGRVASGEALAAQK